jgi:hypothetical protein
MGGHGLDSSGSVQGSVAGSCFWFCSPMGTGTTHVRSTAYFDIRSRRNIRIAFTLNKEHSRTDRQELVSICSLLNDAAGTLEYIASNESE